MFECYGAVFEILYWCVVLVCFWVKTADVGWLVEGRWKTAINFTNKLGSQGKLAGAFAKLLHEMWGEDLPFVSPTDFRVSFVPIRPFLRFGADSV